LERQPKRNLAVRNSQVPASAVSYHGDLAGREPLGIAALIISMAGLREKVQLPEDLMSPMTRLRMNRRRSYDGHLYCISSR
jgi:hypothetical protein